MPLFARYLLESSNFLLKLMNFPKNIFLPFEKKFDFFFSNSDLISPGSRFPNRIVPSGDRLSSESKVFKFGKFVEMLPNLPLARVRPAQHRETTKEETAKRDNLMCEIASVNFRSNIFHGVRLERGSKNRPDFLRTGYLKHSTSFYRLKKC